MSTVLSTYLTLSVIAISLSSLRVNKFGTVLLLNVKSLTSTLEFSSVSNDALSDSLVSIVVPATSILVSLTSINDLVLILLFIMLDVAM